MKHTIYCRRKIATDAIMHHKTGELIWDGKPIDIVIGSFDDESIALNFMANVKTNDKVNLFKIWMS